MRDLPPREFAASVRAYCAEHELFRPGDRVLVGVSGGPDSTALLLVLHELAPRLGVSLIAAHLDHGLRRGAAADARFVRELARRHDRPFVAARVNVRRLAARRRMSVEEAGRLARYAFLHRAARRLGAGVVAVGHQRDDQAETFLLRLVRGSSGSGLAGIAPARPLVNPLAPAGGRAIRLVRPLLARSRDEIEAYLARRGARARRDPTNRGREPLRNRIRHELLPLLARRFNPGAGVLLARAAQALGEDGLVLDGLAARALTRAGRGPGRLAVAAVRRLPLAVRRRVLRAAAVAGGADPRALAQTHLDALVRLAAAASGRSSLPGAAAARAGALLVIRPTRR